MPFFWWTVIVVLLGGILESYTLCVIAGALPCFTKEFALCPSQEGMAASTILLGALFGAAITGYVADRFGRKRCLVFVALLFFLTASSVFFVTYFSGLLTLRFFKGIAVGMMGVLAPLYLAEVAPPKQRGMLVAAFYISLALGTLFAYAANMLLINSENWRLMFFLSAIPALFQLGGLGFLQESPRWLLGSGQTERAQRASELLYGNEAFIEHPIEEVQEDDHLHLGWGYLFHPCFFYVLFLGFSLSLFQQLCGINAVIAFSPKILAYIGFDSLQEAMLPTLCLGFMNLLATIIATRYIEQFGRKRLLLWSQLGVCLSLLLFLVAYIFEFENLDSWGIFALSIYIGCYSVGLGPVVWVVIAEIYPLAVRAKAMSLATLISWLGHYLVVLSFPWLLARMSLVWIFSAYGLITSFSMILFWFALPETKGKSLEEIEHLLIPKEEE